MPKHCRNCWRKTERAFYIDDRYIYSICSLHRWDFEGDVNKIYAIKAISLFQSLWKQAKRNLNLKIPKDIDLKKFVFKRQFTFDVPRYNETWFCYKTIRSHIVHEFDKIKVYLGKRDPGFDPESTIDKCLRFALSKKILRSKFLKRKNAHKYDRWWMNHYVRDDFPFVIKE